MNGFEYGYNGAGIIGIGVDIVAHARFEELLTRRPKVADRIFTDSELAYAGRCTGSGRTERLAARFAAKEAVSKAIGVSLFSMRLKDIEIQSSSGGRPQVALLGSAAVFATDKGVGTIMLSLSHEHEMSVAFAVALGRATSK